MSDSFSKRKGFIPQEIEIKIREEAPFELRGVLVDLFYEIGFTPSSLRAIFCQVLRKRADENNWSEYPNIDNEVRYLIDNCEWYKVYDIVEQIAQSLNSHNYEKFENELNEYFKSEGIGWNLENGYLEMRGSEAFQKIVHDAKATMEKENKVTASSELHEAIQDLSRRPDPDITGAIQHSMASLECIAREITGDKKSTLGVILGKNKKMIPPPLDKSVELAWGFASEMERHLREGRNPSFEEAELIVGICASVGNYLLKK
ncbi:MAG: hypothetical protein KF816_17030 [Melioribacteraceae bacterium]|nr:hypothetical protein [Melioribacteraceae bacterium]